MDPVTSIGTFMQNAPKVSWDLPYRVIASGVALIGLAAWAAAQTPTAFIHDCFAWMGIDAPWTNDVSTWISARATVVAVIALVVGCVMFARSGSRLYLVSRAGSTMWICFALLVQTSESARWIPAVALVVGLVVLAVALAARTLWASLAMMTIGWALIDLPAAMWSATAAGGSDGSLVGSASLAQGSRTVSDQPSESP